MNNLDAYRRKFLTLVAGSAGFAAATLVPNLVLRQAQAKADDESISNQQRWGLLIDINKLEDGGDACITACKKEHGWGDDPQANLAQQSQWIRKVKVTKKDSGNSFSLPIMCQHCETAPCVDVCPTGASMKRADGIVQVDKHIEAKVLLNHVISVFIVSIRVSNPPVSKRHQMRLYLVI